MWHPRLNQGDQGRGQGFTHSASAICQLWTSRTSPRPHFLLYEEEKVKAWQCSLPRVMVETAFYSSVFVGAESAQLLSQTR